MLLIAGDFQIYRAGIMIRGLLSGMLPDAKNLFCQGCSPIQKLSRLRITAGLTMQKQTGKFFRSGSNYPINVEMISVRHD